MITTKSAALAVVTAALMASGASATVAKFEGTGFNRGSGIPAGYGNRVTDPTFVQDGYSYGSAYGLTPNIVAAWDDEDRAWDTQYGDLVDVSYADSKWRAKLTADEGWLVCLHGFDLGGWRETDRSVDLIEVRDEGGNLVYTASDVFVFGGTVNPETGNRTTRVEFEIPLVGQELSILLRFGGENCSNVGIDNIGYSQKQIPTPGALALLGVGGVVAGRRRRTR